LPFPLFVTTDRAGVKWLALFGVEISRSPAFMATALNPQPTTPGRQISALADAPPKPSGITIAPR
jgi:hypothetical protein